MDATIDDRIYQRTRPSLVDSDAIYCTGEESLRLSSFNSLAGVELVLEARFTNMNGGVSPLSQRHVPLSTRAIATTVVPLGDGFLGNVQVRATVGAPQQGQCFVLVELVRGSAGALQPLATLLSGYASDVQRLAWPGSPLASSVAGNGFLRSFLGTDPAANTEISEVVPTGARWRVQCVSFVLVADANAANREVMLVVDDGVNVLLHSPAGVDHLATLTKRYTFGAFGAAQPPTQQTSRIGLLPPIILAAGSRIQTNTVNRQVGDNYGAPQLLLEEWIAG